MKILVFIFVIAFLFMFVFFKSNTLESHSEKEYRGDVEYLATKYTIHWNRFFSYLEDIPEKISNTINKITSLILKKTD